MASRYLITGATGFVGGHVAEACAARGHAVSTIARPSSDTSMLERLGITVHRGDLKDSQVLRKAIDEADVVIHCAAKVGDTGAVDEYRDVNVDGLRALLDACRGRPLQRFVHLSSLGVYEPRHHYGTDESVPAFFSHFDGYTQSKAEAEQVAMTYHRDYQSPVVILRPGFVYGPRDRTVLPKLIARMETSKIHYLGGDRLALNAIYIGNLVDAIFLAVENPKGVGRIYNLTDGEAVSKRRFIEKIADAMGYRRPRQVLPRWLAALLVKVILRRIRRAGPTGKPPITFAQYKFLCLNLDFSIAKAHRELGYQPRVSFDEGMRQTMAWYKQKA
jgi:nucleoside-diphosphate-sugar epimerase